MRYSQIKQALREAEIIDEVSMSPSSLEKFANSPEAEGMLMGIEFEMCVPNASSGDDEPEWEYDWDANESAYDIDEIINFFRNGEFSSMGRSDAERARSQLYNEYLEWHYEGSQNYVDENYDEVIKKTRENLQDDARDASNNQYDDFVADAKKELGELLPDDDAAIEERVRELTLLWMDRWIDEQIEEADSREYERAREAAEEELQDEWRDSYASQTDWLESIGVDDMQDAHRYWDLDWPHMYDANYRDEGSADVDQVAEAFTDGTGFPARGYSNYHSGSRSQQQEQGYFIIEPDGSIDADSDDAGLEFISPAMPLKDGIEMLKKVQAWAKSEGCYTNKSTGLHMNISVPNMTIESLDYVKLALFLGDEHVLSEFGRTYNSYCKSAMKIVKEKIQQNPENATALLNKMKEHLGAAASKLVHSGVTQKYTSINTKDKYVEFRGPGGDYLDQDLTKLTGTALRLAQALRIATDDNAYKQEYAKKLYKLVSPNEGDWTDPNNSVSLFSRYAMGQINKDELVSNVRQAQTARKEKKGEEQQYWVMNKDGTGGKQMVFAQSVTDAIIKGGKQLGMKREDSISKLKAEPFERTPPGPSPTKPAPESLTGGWINWIKDKAPTADANELFRIEQELKAGNFSYLDDESTQYLLDYINELIEFRKESSTQIPDSVPEGWKSWVEDTLPNVTLAIANEVRQRIKDGRDGLDQAANVWIIQQIDNELRRRQNARNTAGPMPDTLPTPWQRWARDIAPRALDSDLRETKRRLQSGSYAGAGLTDDDTNYLLNLIDDIIANRQATNNDGSDSADEMTRWRVSSASGSSVYVDAVTPRQAKLAAVDLFAIEHGLNVDANDLVAIAATQGSGAVHAIPQQWRNWVDTLPNRRTEVIADFRRQIEQGEHNPSLESQQQRDAVIRAIDDELRRRQDAGETGPRELFDSLPEGTRSWLERVGEHHDLELRQALDHIEAGRGIGSGLYSNQVAFVKTAIETELRRRSNNDAVDNDDTTRNPVFDTLPQHWKDYIANDLSYSADMHLINMLRNLSREDAGRNLTLTDQQLAYIRILLKRQLRANGINPDDDAPTNTFADDADERERMRREREQISQDMRSHDDEDINDLMGSESDEEAPQGVDPEHSEWEIYNPATGQVVSRVRQGDVVYAVRKAREHEQDLGLATGALDIRAINQTNESINLLRKLAGLL